jgi:hypothetical protein
MLEKIDKIFGLINLLFLGTGVFTVDVLEANGGKYLILISFINTIIICVFIWRLIYRKYSFQFKFKINFATTFLIICLFNLIFKLHWVLNVPFLLFYFFSLILFGILNLFGNEKYR